MEPDYQLKSPDIKEVADLLAEVASTLMTSGSHTMRIIQNVSRMANIFGYQMELSVFQLSIMMTITSIENSSQHLTLVKKSKPQLLNFTLVSELSALSWDTFDKKLTFNESKDKYQKIISKKRTSEWLVLFLVSCANAAFCRLFHGDFYAVGLVFLATMIGLEIRQLMIRKNINHLIAFTASSFFASLFAGMAYVFRLGNTPDIAIASSVLFLIPGVPLINSILDIIQGHVLTGTARLVNACSLIVCIAIGLFGSMLILGLEKL
jgi:uncharacterized membrane protein YjjP (DUF1212 family)